jgi:hypothetical protein
MPLKVLVLCASDASRHVRKAEKMLEALQSLPNSQLPARMDLEVYSMGLGLSASKDTACAGTLADCVSAFGRTKFDIIIQEYCPTNQPIVSVLREIITIIEKRASYDSFLVVPVIGRGASAHLVWDEVATPYYGQHPVPWNLLLEELGYEVVDFSAHASLVLFRRGGDD